MKVLITGVAGFIGSHLADQFTDVTGVDNLYTGSITTVPKHVDFALCDVSDPDCKVYKQDYNLILHFACPASPPAYQRKPILTMRANSHATYNLMEKAKECNATILVASTSEVYGEPLHHPQKETDWGNVNPIGVRSCYDEGKRYMEAMTMAYYRQGVDTRIIRIFNTYGPRMAADDGRVIPNFITQSLAGQPMTIYGNGGQTRSMCYIDDLVAGILKVVEGGDHMPYNIGNPQEVSMSQLAEMIGELTGSTLTSYHPLPGDDPTRRRPDISRMQELGWSPSVQLPEGLKRTVEYFKEK